MLIDVINVKPKNDFTLWLKFKNGEVREFDCKPLLEKKPFKKLKDKYFFDMAKVEYGTVVWSDEIDIASEILYLDRSHLSYNFRSV